MVDPNTTDETILAHEMYNRLAQRRDYEKTFRLKAARDLNCVSMELEIKGRIEAYETAMALVFELLGTDED